MSSIIYKYSDDFSSIAKSNSMQLDEQTITRFRVAKEFPESKRINALDFSPDGKYLLTSSDDDTIRLFDCEKGVQSRELFSKKYGVDLIQHTHARNTAIHTSTKENDTIRYLSLHDNKYLRYFSGHEKRVVTLCMSPADDTFMSGSLDHTVRLWDLKSDKPIAKLTFTPSESPLGSAGPYYSGPIANFDPEGLIFAVGVESETIKFFDLRHHSKGPFNTIKLTQRHPHYLSWHSLKFSPDGKQMLVITNCEELLVLDAFTGELKHKLAIGQAVSHGVEVPCEASYTPDSKFIIGGSDDGSIHVWCARTGHKLNVLRPPRGSEPIYCVRFNPRYMMIATGSYKLNFWIPDDDDAPPSQII